MTTYLRNQAQEKKEEKSIANCSDPHNFQFSPSFIRQDVCMRIILYDKELRKYTSSNIQ